MILLTIVLSDDETAEYECACELQLVAVMSQVMHDHPHWLWMEVERKP